MIFTFTLTTLVSAFLLFLIQPMFAKMTLPLLGGTPAIWNTALVFYQFILLLGYCYSHIISTYFGFRKQFLLQSGLMLLTLVALPISVSTYSASIAQSNHALWLLGLFAMSIGLPFFTLSTMAPLLQKWFTCTNHPSAQNPYFLYASSNFGSVAALLSYPFIVEPNLGLMNQGILWSVIYLLLVLLVIVCISRIWKYGESDFAESDHKSIKESGSRVAITWFQRVRWIALAFVPTSLLISVTSHISTDLASIPLLWIIPLTLFLLTFIIVFSRNPLIKHVWMLNVQAYLLPVLVALLFFVFGDFKMHLIVHVAIFFICAMVCHGELAQSKPPAKHLTEFYLYMSIGGALGGATTAILAPVVFSEVYEYPIGIVFACLIRPLIGAFNKKVKKSDLIIPLTLSVVSVPALMIFLSYGVENRFALLAACLIFVINIMSTITSRGRPIRFAFGIAVIILLSRTIVGDLSDHGSVTQVESERSFFAVHKITHDKESGLYFLRHGTTIHGVQEIDQERWRRPVSYYHENGPAGQFFSKFNVAESSKDVAVVGLGLGTLVCYKKPDQNWRVFEIDPVVVQIAKNTKYFHYMEECGAEVPVVIGDARQTLRKERDGSYDLLVLDAFSSDSIPMHLLTVEAISMYMQKLKEDGILLMHISSRHFDLAKLIGRQIENTKLHAKVQYFDGSTENEVIESPSIWVVVSDDETAVESHTTHAGWEDLPDHHDIQVWTDDYSNILQLIR